MKNRLDLPILTAKTQAVLFDKYTLIKIHTDLKLNNKTVKVTNDLKYLGLILDTKLK